MRAPTTTESEPAFTKSVLAPLVRIELNKLKNLPLQFRGDGGDSLAFPATALDISFYPDLAVSAGSQHLWAAEVKILRSRGRQNAIATALGQATLYRSRYENVSVILIDTAPAPTEAQTKIVEDAVSFGLSLVVRRRVGIDLLQQL